jgi:hypothetical protein
MRLRRQATHASGDRADQHQPTPTRRLHAWQKGAGDIDRATHVDIENQVNILLPGIGIGVYPVIIASDTSGQRHAIRTQPLGFQLGSRRLDRRPVGDVAGRGDDSGIIPAFDDPRRARGFLDIRQHQSGALGGAGLGDRAADALLCAEDQYCQAFESETGWLFLCSHHMTPAPQF